jgi:hypothetical protein
VGGAKKKPHDSMEMQNVQFLRHSEGRRSHETGRSVSDLEIVAGIAWLKKLENPKLVYRRLPIRLARAFYAFGTNVSTDKG